MITEIILVALSVIVLIIASIYDIKTREVPDNLSIGFIVTALAIRLIHSIVTSEYTYFFYGLIGFAAMFLIGLIMYRTKQWGGADAKLLMGLGAAFATQPFFSNFNLPFLLILFISIIIIGGVYGFVFGLVIFFKNKKKLGKELNKNLAKNKATRNTFLIITVILVISTLFIPLFEAKAVIIFFALFLVFYYYLVIFVKTIENNQFLKQVALSKVTEGDWLAKDVVHKNKVLISKNNPCLTIKDLKLLKKNKINKIWIRIGIPFVPAMTLATIFTILISMVF
ncbi:MAG: A24 family peptidase [archaeon]